MTNNHLYAAWRQHEGSAYLLKGLAGRQRALGSRQRRNAACQQGQ